MTAITAIGIAPVMNAHATIAAPSPHPAISSSGRKPYRLRSGVVAGLIPMLPTNTKSTTRPDFTALQPSASWNISGSRNGTAPTAIQNSEPPDTDARNVLIFRVLRSTSGLSLRSRCHTAAPSSSTAAAPVTSAGPVFAEVSDSRWAAQVSAPSPVEVRMTPSQSRRGGAAAAGAALISRQATAKATTPRGMLMRNIQRQFA